MSAKWVRVKRWDDQHLTGALRPVKWLLRVFSAIPTAIVLLLLVAIYGILASVPIGLIAKIPTLLVYALTFVLTLGLVALLPTWGAARALRGRGVGRAGRSLVWVIGLIALAAAASAGWVAFIWPQLRYDPASGRGLMFFSSFVQRYGAVQARRLPGMEMSELEFYAWWPLKLILALFVVNLVTATLRRIEFIVPKIGVLMVHTGIVTIALGSMVYAGLKQEGDMVLTSGGIGADGKPLPGPSENGFYDNTDVALWISTDGGSRWEQRPLRGVPRYNDHNLTAVGGVLANDPKKADPAHREYEPLDIRVDGPAPVAAEQDAGGGALGPVSFRIVGYASYCELRSTSVESTPAPGERANPMREVEVWLKRPDPEGKSPAPVDRPQKTYKLMPASPAERVDVLEGALGTEYTIGMDAARWADLQESLPAGAMHALVIEVPGAKFRGVFDAVPGREIAVGNTGYRVQVKQLMAQPPFPIITKGYEGASSSVAIVRVTPPAGSNGGATGFDRWVYHRFPEISQDLLDEKNERGMPKRRDADAAIRIDYIDASMMQVYFDEVVSTRSSVPAVRAIVRAPGGAATVTPKLEPGQDLTLAPALSMRLGRRAEHAREVEVPWVVPPIDRKKDNLGNHQSAAIALEISTPFTKHREIKAVWIPFTQYLGVDDRGAREVTLPDGRSIGLVFGRVRHELPMRLSLRDFEMIPYPHGDQPQDYRSDVMVSSTLGGAASDQVRSTSLNAPLLVRVPFQDREDVPRVANWVLRVASWIIPQQYKFSQNGWDSAGWRESQAMVARGELPRPHARFTILGVGNNPGIYIIATGAVLMSIGIPWAFYLKPILMKRRKRRLQRQLAKEGRLPAHLMHEIGLIKAWPPAPAEIAIHNGAGDGGGGGVNHSPGTTEQKAGATS